MVSKNSTSPLCIIERDEPSGTRVELRCSDFGSHVETAVEEACFDGGCFRPHYFAPSGAHDFVAALAVPAVVSAIVQHLKVEQRVQEIKRKG